MIAFGSRVSAEFRDKVLEICGELGLHPDHLMACMAFETGETFDPKIKNAAGSGAVGLIQWMPSTAAALGTSTEALMRMSAVQQLDYVAAYFRPWAKRIKSLNDMYMAILWPGAVGKPDDRVLFFRNDSRPKRYIQNAGLDWNKDGKITKGEACEKVRAKLVRGMQLAK